MKTFRLILISTMVCLSLVQTANARDWRLVGNGGGGITDKNGTSTLYEKFKILHWNEIDTAEFVSLNRLLAVIVNLRVSNIRKGEIINALVMKKYFAITPDKLSKDLIDRVTDIYAQLWNTPRKQITLFALTTVESDETLLLPAFFNLSANEQIAVLLHEALWTVAPKLSYAHMIEIESAFYNFLEQKTYITEYRFYAALAKYVFNPHFLVQAVFLLQRNLPVQDILGEELIHCLKKDISRCSYKESSLTLLSSVLKEFKNLRVSLVAYERLGPFFAAREYTFSELYMPEDWPFIWAVPFNDIPFFHRDRTCVRLQSNDPERNNLFVAIYPISFTGSQEIQELCTDVVE